MVVRFVRPLAAQCLCRTAHRVHTMDTHRHMKISGHLYNECERVNLLTANDCAIYFLFTIALAIVMYKSTIKFNCVCLGLTLFVVSFAHVTAFSLSTVHLQIQLGNQSSRNDK